MKKIGSGSTQEAPRSKTSWSHDAPVAFFLVLQTNRQVSLYVLAFMIPTVPMFLFFSFLLLFSKYVFKTSQISQERLFAVAMHLPAETRLFLRRITMIIHRQSTAKRTVFYRRLSTLPKRFQSRVYRFSLISERIYSGHK